MKSLVGQGDYEKAEEIADTINWRKVKNVNSLVHASEIYSHMQRYEDSRDVLLMAYDRSPIGRTIIYRLAELAIHTHNFDEAKEVEEKIKKLELDYNKEKNNYDELLLKNRELHSVENIKRKSLNELENKLGDYNSNSLQKEIDLKQKELKILEEKVLFWEEDKDKTINEIYEIKDKKYKVPNLNFWKKEIRLGTF